MQPTRPHTSTRTAVRDFTLTATYGDHARAREAADALRAAGFTPDNIDVRRALVAPQQPKRRFVPQSFVGRLTWIIVLWSIPGTVLGAALGWLLAWASIGPGGTDGTVLQIVGWAIFGHLIAGMWAGYLLLSDRSRHEFNPDRAADETLVTVRCRTRSEIDVAGVVLRSRGARSVRQSVR